LHKALAEVERAQADMEAAAQIRTKLRSSSTVQHDREAEALLRREEDLVDGYADVSFRGFTTVSADTEQALDEAHSQTVDASHQARVVLAPLYGQQAAALVAAALPIGVQATGVKKGK
jgi:TRAP-type mannitol/chloroaromatic compound transport system substrate-binding protein